MPLIGGHRSAFVDRATGGSTIAAFERRQRAAASLRMPRRPRLARIERRRSERITSLEYQREAQLQDTIDGQRRAGQVVVASRREARAQLENTRADLVVARTDLDAARAGLRALRGPVDGRRRPHIVKVIAVGTEQSPPRMWCRSVAGSPAAAARRAAIADGVIVPGQPLPPALLPAGGRVDRTLDAEARGHRHQFADSTEQRRTADGDPHGVRTHLAQRDVPWARRAAHDPFWIRVFDGEVWRRCSSSATRRPPTAAARARSFGSLAPPAGIIAA